LAGFIGSLSLMAPFLPIAYAVPVACCLSAKGMTPAS
jgi:hypothetical protein